MEVDVSQGKERIPVQGPDGSICFQYVKTNVPGPSFDVNQFMDEYAGCQCVDKCDKLTCPCVQLFGPAYDDNGHLLDTWYAGGNSMNRSIFECGDNCTCKSEQCSLRVVQQGIAERLSVIETQTKGYGLQAIMGIKHLKFVCEYAGEVVSEKEAKIRLDRNQKEGLMNYLIAVKESSPSSKHCIYVDPCNIGNVGRFINHSCDPNLVMIPVRVNHSVPRLALFSRRDICPLEELTFDYSGNTTLLITNHITSSAPQGELRTPFICDQELVYGENVHCQCAGTDEQKQLNSSRKKEVKNNRTKFEDASKNTECLCGSKYCNGYLPVDEYLFDE